MVNQYRVWMHSKPGFWEHYDGHVDVWAEDPQQAEEKALDKLKRGNFPERGRSSWTIDRIEVLR